MNTIEIYWNDLTEEMQEYILSVVGDNANYDIIPIAEIQIDVDEDGNQRMRNG